MNSRIFPAPAPLPAIHVVEDQPLQGRDDLATVEQFFEDIEKAEDYLALRTLTST